MSKNAKKVSISQVDKIMKEYFELTTNVEWKGIDITVTKSLSLADMLQFCNDVVKTCTNPDNGGYMPELKDFAIRMNVVEMYSNVKLPDNLEHKYYILINSGLVEAILEHVNTNQYFELVESINDKLKAIVDANTDAIEKQLNEVAHAFEQMQANMETAMNGLDMSVLERLANTFGDEDVMNKAILSYVKDSAE